MIVGIGGISRAGKGTLSKLLCERLLANDISAIAIHQDDFVLSEELIPTIKGKTDWETPHSIDWERLESFLHVEKSKHEIVLLEGLFCYSNPGILNLIDIKIFIEISKSKFIDRKNEDLRWGSDPEPKWYIEHIWQSYLDYGRPKLTKDYLCVNGSRFFDIKYISDHILKR